MRKFLSEKARAQKNKYHQEYYEAVKDIIEHPVVKRMKQFQHHYHTSCFGHCLHVSFLNFLICKKIHLDARTAARAGMLHDLFLYDWHQHAKETGDYFHGLTHPRYVVHIAEKYFKLTKKEKEIILHHMWPITISPPKSKEGYVTTVTDKISGIFEMVDYYIGKN